MQLLTWLPSGLTYFKKLTNTMKNIIKLIAFSFAIFIASQAATAQIGSGRLYHFDLDTLTNADTLNLEFFKKIDEEYTFTWQVSVTNEDDTTNVTGYIQERLSENHAWVNVDTISFDDTGSVLVKGNTTGFHQRLRLLSANTGVTSVRATVWYVRRKF